MFDFIKDFPKNRLDSIRKAGEFQQRLANLKF